MKQQTRYLCRSVFAGLAAGALSTAIPNSLHAQPPRPAGAETPAQAPSADVDHLAQQVQNPVANLVTVPLQNNTSFDIGPYHRAANVLNVQPVIPLSLSDDWMLINRLILPIAYQPDIGQATNGVTGVGDINATFWVSPHEQGAFMWGVGPVVSLPTATQTVTGTGHWTAGPSAVALFQQKPWTIGALANNMWSYAGESGRSSVNQLLAQYFINYSLPGGWFLTSSPIITANWKATSGNIWTIPFGGGVGKVFKVASQAMNAEIGAFWNAASPNDRGAAWQTRLQIGFLFPEKEQAQQAASAQSGAR